MKNHCKTSAIALALVTIHLSPFAFRLHAAVPTEWQVRIGPKATVYQAERYHGDALDLRATLTSGGLPLVYQGAARLYAQTNGMGTLWWDLAPVTVASNVLAATWRPEFDTGADVVDVFLGAPSNFQAHARIRFLPSPGPAPNSLPMPTPVLDFAAVELRNISALTNGWSFGDSGGPYLSATGGVVSGTVKVEGKVGASADNGDAELGRDGVRVKRAGFPFSQVLKFQWPSAGNGTFARLEDIPAALDLTDATNYTDAALAEFAATGTVWRSASYGTATRWTDATGCVWEAGWSFSGVPVAATTPQLTFNPADIGAEWTFSWFYDGQLEYYGTEGSDSATRLTIVTDHGTVTATRNTANLVGRVAYTNDIPDMDDYATKDDAESAARSAARSAVEPVSNLVETVRAESSLVYRLYSGSNVVAEVTNYNSQVHAPSLRLMQLNESNEYVTVWTETNGLARTLRDATNYTDRAIADYAAPRAWSRTTSGLGAEAPANTTWISTPTTVIAGGFEYAKFVDTYGEVWVLSSNGMAAEFNPDTNAYFRITADDGTPVFSVEKTDAQLVGANAAGITVGESTITIPVPVVSSTAPTMYWRSSLSSGDWADESAVNPNYMSVDWTGGPGSWVCNISFDGSRPPMMFFKFNFLQEGVVVIRNNATTDLSSGIYVGGVKFVPSVSGNNLIWTKQ